MFVTMMKSKLHRAVVTDANLSYVGSITIDADLLAAADLLEYERVQVLDINNGARLETYIMTGEPGTGVVCLNGAAARLVQRGDHVIILSYGVYEQAEARAHVPIIVLCDDRNRPASVIREKPGMVTPLSASP